METLRGTNALSSETGSSSSRSRSFASNTVPRPKSPPGTSRDVHRTPWHPRLLPGGRNWWTRALLLLEGGRGKGTPHLSPDTPLRRRTIGLRELFRRKRARRETRHLDYPWRRTDCSTIGGGRRTTWCSWSGVLSRRSSRRRTIQGRGPRTRNSSPGAVGQGPRDRGRLIAAPTGLLTVVRSQDRRRPPPPAEGLAPGAPGDTGRGRFRPGPTLSAVHRSSCGSTTGGDSSQETCVERKELRVSIPTELETTCLGVA